MPSACGIFRLLKGGTILGADWERETRCRTMRRHRHLDAVSEVVASFLVAWSLWAVHRRWALVGRVILAVCLVAAIVLLIPLVLDPGL